MECEVEEREGKGRVDICGEVGVRADESLVQLSIIGSFSSSCELDRNNRVFEPRVRPFLDVERRPWRIKEA